MGVRRKLARPVIFMVYGLRTGFKSALGSGTGNKGAIGGYSDLLGNNVGWHSFSSPPIRIGRVSGTGQKGILISVLTLQPGEEEIVARRLMELLSKSADHKKR